MERRESVVGALLAHGLAAPRRLRTLTTAEIAAVLREKGAAHLWITDVFGDISQRIEPRDCFRFWKSELKGRVLEEPGFAREQWLGGYAYSVSEWTSPYAEPLLEVKRCE